MPISAKCPACGKGHKAPDKLAGRIVACLGCGLPFTIPEPTAELAPADPEPTYQPEAVEPRPQPVAPPRPRKPAVADRPPLTVIGPPLWLRHLHWLLALALIPLAVSLLAGRQDSVAARIQETLERASPEDRERFDAAASQAKSFEDLINALPNHRAAGAMLPRSTAVHWVLALVAAMLFLAFTMFLASDGSANPAIVLVVGLATATVGVGFLFIVQILAAVTQGRVIIGRGITMLIFAVLRFIAFSYAAAENPENGFLLSFLGFTFGVGLCEELVKAAPVFLHRDDEKGANWRGLFIWGLASGAGFGIAEGILYSGRYYNGITGPGAYAVRFLSCVALHAIWTGSVAVTLYLRRDMFDHLDAWHDWIGPVLFVIGLPMILHGLYDTCLKRDLNAAALLVAVASFGYLAFLNSRLHGADDRAARRAMRRESKRRRAMA